MPRTFKKWSSKFESAFACAFSLPNLPRGTKSGVVSRACHVAPREVRREVGIHRRHLLLQMANDMGMRLGEAHTLDQLVDLPRGGTKGGELGRACEKRVATGSRRETRSPYARPRSSARSSGPRASPPSPSEATRATTRRTGAAGPRRSQCTRART